MANRLFTVLEKIGSGFEKFFDKAIPIAEAAEPIIDVAFPFIGPLYNTTVALVKAAEGAAAAAAARRPDRAPRNLRWYSWRCSHTRLRCCRLMASPRRRLRRSRHTSTR